MILFSYGHSTQHEMWDEISDLQFERSNSEVIHTIVLLNTPISGPSFCINSFEVGLKLKILYRISQSTQETFPVQYKRKIYISKKKNLHRNSRQGNKEKRGEKVVFGKFIFEDFQDNFCRSRGVLGRDARRYGDVGTGYQHFLADY